MWKDISSWVGEAAAVFVKEWRCEFRTRYALNTLALFALTTLVVVSVSLGPLGATGDERAAVLPVLLWIILLFAATAGLPRSFLHEEESHTATALRLAAPPSALFCGKALYGVVLVMALELLVTPLYVAMMQLTVARPGQLLAALAAGGYGLAVGSVFIASLIGQARGKATLFAVVSFPVLLPLLLFSIQLSVDAVAGQGDGQALQALLLYDGSLTVAALMLFPLIWNP
jgi:heme exporter protein B